jgi:hypothetical protein
MIGSRVARWAILGPKRVCWNSWIAPHNLTTDYAAWPYRDLLEARIANAAANVEVFRRQPLPARRP